MYLLLLPSPVVPAYQPHNQRLPLVFSFSGTVR